MNLRVRARIILGLSLLLFLNLFVAASSFAIDAKGPAKSSKSNNKVAQRYFLGFGPTTYSNLNTSGAGVIFSGGYIWNLDPEFDLLLTADFGTSFKHTDLIMLCPQLKGRYSFSDPEANTTAYAGAGMGIGYSQNHSSAGHPKDNIMSFAVSVAAGIKFYRNTPYPIFAELEHLMYIEESAYGTPISTSLKVGIAIPIGSSKKSSVSSY